MAVYYSSEYIYITSTTVLKERLARIRAIIVALMDTQLQAALSDNISEYSLDDGQTKIRTVNRSSGDIAKTIEDLQRIEQTYLNQLNGRVIRLVDGKNFTGR
jgi:hypothetical protein